MGHLCYTESLTQPTKSMKATNQRQSGEALAKKCSLILNNTTPTRHSLQPSRQWKSAAEQQKTLYNTLSSPHCNFAKATTAHHPASSQ